MSHLIGTRAIDAGLAFSEKGDPVFGGNGQGYVWGMPLVLVLVKVVVAFVVLLVATMFMVWFERKVISDMQARIGPNRAGPFGLFQTFADGTKLLFKENLFPDKADRIVFRLAPYLAVVPAFLTFAIIPVGGAITIAHHTTNLQVADPPMGVLFSLAVSSIAVYGVMLAGWASGSKYPLLGSIRASAQMVSYEAAMGLGLAAVVLVSSSLRTQEIVAKQAVQTGFPFSRWNIIAVGVVPAIIFAIAATAELNRPPFDLVEAEQELVGGFNTEYSSARFAFFFLAEFMNTITMSALIVTLFLGGPSLPFRVPFFGATSPLWFLIKLLGLLFVYVWLRGTLPRYRYDQLMDLGWKRLIPLALGWVLLIAALRIARNYDVRTTLRYMAIAAVGLAASAAVLLRALKVGRQTSDRETQAALAKSAESGRAGRF